MSKNKLSELTIAELNEKKSFLSRIVTATGIVILILCSVILYLSFTKQNSALISVIPVCLLSIIPGTIKLIQITAEIKSRNLTK